ncbi:MAG TPA: glycosyltransferase family 2 protein [Candidatus Microsaccharimonas sp.]|jgi:glycosyltransferase involved in cell wall biosynthesis
MDDTSRTKRGKIQTMSAKEMKVCVVIPAYNEEAVIKDVVEDMRNELKKTNLSYEIVVINDGSKDTTSIQASKGGAKVIDHILNSGAGGATATGLSYANQNGFDFAVTMDADGQHLPKDVIRGLNAAKQRGCDLLIGSRLIDNKGMSRVKVLGNQGLSLITFLLFKVSVTDSQSGLRVFSKRALQSLRWKTSGYEFCSEMLWRAKQLGLNITEYPITAVYTEYSKSKGQNNWNAINIVKSLVRRRLIEAFE